MRDHKSLRASVEAHQAVLLVLDLSRDCWRPELRAVFDQLARATLSVQLNIAEGHALGTRRQFLRHLRIAHASAVEAGDLLELLAERSAVAQPVATGALRHVLASRGLLLGLIKKYQVV